MCGILGYIVSPKRKVNSKKEKFLLLELLTLAESRGSDSSGISIVSDNQIRIFKKDLKATQFIKNRNFKKFINKFFSNRENNEINNGYTIIGQARMATNGTERLHNNNQPLACGNIVGVHNGIVVNIEALWEKFKTLSRQNDVDSEIIFRLIDNFYKKSNSLLTSVSDTFKEIEGYTNIAFIHKELNTLTLATNNGSIYILTNSNNDLLVFASEEIMLQKIATNENLKKYIGPYSITQLQPETISIISFKKPELRKFCMMQNNRLNEKLKKEKELRQIIDVSDAKNEGETFARINTVIDDINKISRKYNYTPPSLLPIKRCNKCLLPQTMPFIEFDQEGVCSYCNNYKKVEIFGLHKLKNEVTPLRKINNKNDCIVGLSGGRDSSYGLHYIKTVLKLNPVAYTYDWGMVTNLARRNISRLCGKLKIEHILVSADIRQKRDFIRKNVLAWLKKPHLGMVPLFMAGDKAYFYHAQRLKKELNIDVLFLCENMLERTDFKTGFANVKPFYDKHFVYTQSFQNKYKLTCFYLKQYLTNPNYLNSSFFDSIYAYFYYYYIERNYYNLYNYIDWDEKIINKTLKTEYNWEVADDTTSTWRIGDGTASFYNFIYYTLAGFCENETLRSNQIREGIITRDEGLELIDIENKPRFESIKWYCEVININFKDTMQRIMSLNRLY